MTSKANLAHSLDRVIEALEAIGLEVSRGEVGDSFLPHVHIKNGSLLVEEGAHPTDVLHEAGHLAVLPACLRANATGNIEDIEPHLDRILADHQDDPSWLESPLCRSLMQISDTEATAWAYAFGRKCGLPDEHIIRTDAYDGEGLNIMTMLQLGQYLGVNGLRAAGFISSCRDFPVLEKWLQDAS